MQVRVGIPLTGGKLVAAAREAGYPVLFSANAFFVGYPKGNDREGSFRKFKQIDLDQFAGLDAALDSAGFVAAVRYGDFRWTPEQYMDLAQAFPWTWYASMDYCCEPAVAQDRPLRVLRLSATAQLLGRLNRIADERGMTRPMPVLQGWTAAEYAECAEWLPLAEWPALVGIGSVCRRQLNGPDGIYAILDAVDKVLPPHVKCHLFGVKSTALETLSTHPRVASTDSMGWDYAARCERRVGRDMEYRIGHMHDWAGKQLDIVRNAEERDALEAVELAPAQSNLFPIDEFRVDTTDTSDQSLALEALSLTWGELLLGNHVEYLEAVWGARQDAYPLLARIHQVGILKASEMTEDEFGGFRKNLMCVAERRRPELAARIEARRSDADEARSDTQNVRPALAA